MEPKHLTKSMVNNWGESWDFQKVSYILEFSGQELAIKQFSELIAWVTLTRH